ncbi:hypothetical protein T439DRAFT_358253 [Meredithblackwellia eburnea MCA 4105]
MPHSGVEPLEINLQSSDLVLRGLTGEEAEPALLNGELILNLFEPTQVKDITLAFNGTAKVSWRDTTTHHYDHPIFFHDFNFLHPSPSSTSSPSDHPSLGSSSTKHHAQTLKPGRHLFPFSLHVPGSLPASLRTYSGTCVIEYRLKALVVRPGFGHDWKSKKVVKISRGFGVDAVEYNQTLEIENTWPGKVMYAFTIPHKAYAAGETIPVSVKFSPLAKGVQIASLVTTIREHTTVHSKNSSHSEARDATTVKYNFIPDASGTGTGNNSGTTSPAHAPPRIESTASLASLNINNLNGSGPPTPGFGTFQHGHTSGNAVASGSGLASGSTGTGFPGLSGRLTRPATSDLAGEGEEEVVVADHDGAGWHPEEEEDIDIDTEIDVVVDVPVPIWTAPTHTVHPCFINHKIKWSAFIKNPDGHVSELRCALPIHILASSLAEESRLASSGARNLLFGESGCLAHSDVPQVDLPSYQDHVMDRVANAETASYFSLAAGFTPTPWSARSPGAGTPGVASPVATPPGSRPPSPGPHRNQSSFSLAGLNLGSSSIQPSSLSNSRLASRRSSGSVTPVTPASPPGLVDEEHPEDHRNWVDSELLSTLILDHQSPPGSNPTSRPGSLPGSRANSRPPSPDHSRERDEPTTPGVGTSSSVTFDTPPPLARSSTSSSGFFHLHIPKPLRPLTSFSRNGSSSSLSAMNMSSSSHHPSASAISSALEAHQAKSRDDVPSGRSHRYSSHSPLETITHAPISNSPGGAIQIPTTSSSSSVPSGGVSPVDIAGHSTASPGSSSPNVSSSLHHGHPSSLSMHHLQHVHAASPVQSPYRSGDEEIDFLSQVPSYDVAARGFLGGGAVPLSTSRGLPNYED